MHEKQKQALKPKWFLCIAAVLTLVILCNCYCWTKEIACYSFDSGYDIESYVTNSTDYIKLPGFLRKEAKYICENKTGYQVCVFDSVNGFVEIGQGSCVFEGNPMFIFIAEPEKATGLQGEFSIKKCGANLGAVYTLEKGIGNTVRCDYKLKL